MTDLVKVIRAFKKIREARALNMKEAKKRDAEFKENLEQLSAYLLNVLNTSGTKSQVTDEGTFFKKKVTTPTAADWAVFYKFVVENDAFHFLERRITATAVAAYMKEHKQAPPGVNVFEKYEVHVRKANGGALDIDDEGDD